MLGHVESMFHYPVKGLRGQPLEQAELQAGQGFPFDRVYGFARPGSGFDPEHPRPLPKTKFVMLARDAGLATLDTHFDPGTACLTIRLEGEAHHYDLNQPKDRDAAARVLSRHLNFSDDMTPTLYSAHPHRFTDVSVLSPEMMNAVSLINLESVSAFSEKTGSDVNAARFRGNILFSDIEPFSELDWVGRTVTIDEAELKVVQRTKRCPATEVDPTSGKRDLDVPRLLSTHYGHSDMGVYAEVCQGGVVRRGAQLSVR